ncbi:MAG: DUF3109 family protein [Bacteroidaceae bacterium]|nr:DUF3109 family protein [Bacteroidaceae bacterium]
MDSQPSFGSMLMVGDVVVHTDILTEYFCCDLAACHGRCCVEGDAGAPVTMDEVARLEECLDTVWPQLTAQAQSIIDRQGVSYVDREGELVTSIVSGRDCAFVVQKNDCALCALECAFRDGRTRWRKPISCALYPIREKKLGAYVGLSYHRWDICREAVQRGTEMRLPLYRFLREPLIERFGQAWYEELETAVGEMQAQGLL